MLTSLCAAYPRLTARFTCGLGGLACCGGEPDPSRQARVHSALAFLEDVDKAKAAIVHKSVEARG